MDRQAPLRAWATVPQPQARVVVDRNGREWIAYTGIESALKLLEAGSQGYATTEDIRRLNPDIEGPAAWLLLPCDQTSILLVETIGKLDQVGTDYLEIRQRVIGRHDKFAHLYPETPPELQTPFPHQIECFSATLESLDQGRHGFGCFMEMGLGKHAGP